jgi:inhibitor of cysteine peptidase
MCTTRATPALPALALAAALVAAGCAQHVGEPETAIAQVTLTSAHEGQQAAIAPSRVMTVRLPSQPATGFIWEVEQIDRSVLKPLDDAHEYRGEAGGEATHVHRFLPSRRGRTRLKLVYHRPWQTDVPPAQTYTIDLDVEGTTWVPQQGWSFMTQF